MQTKKFSPQPHRREDVVYTPRLVENFLKNMLHIRSMLECGGGVELPDNYYIRTPSPPKDRNRERPLGMKLNDPRGWPFRETQHAKEPFDGKAKARATQELHCGLLDLEIALTGKDMNGNYFVTKDDYDLLVKYYIEQSHTLDDLLRERGTSSRGSMQQRIHRSVERLTSVLESRHV